MSRGLGLETLGREFMREASKFGSANWTDWSSFPLTKLMFKVSEYWSWDAALA